MSLLKSWKFKAQYDKKYGYLFNLAENWKNIWNCVACLRSAYVFAVGESICLEQHLIRENKRFFSFEMKHLGFQLFSSVSASLYS